MGSAKQRKARAARARAHQRRGSPNTDRSKLEALLTDEQILAWGRDLGVELTERSHLLDSAAVGLTVVCWRNTVLEHIHAGGERRDRLDEALHNTTDAATVPAAEAAYEQELQEFYDGLDADIESYISVADPAEAARIGTLLTGRASGFGIPDDIMLRLNASTAGQVRAALDVTLDEAATQPGARKLAQSVHFSDLVGARRALWYTALSGASCAQHWFPAPAWAKGVASLRAALAAGDFDRVVWDARSAPPATWAPADDDALWATLSSSPERLNGRQARWVINFSRLHDHLDDAREADRRRLGPLDTGRFSGIMAMM